MKLGVVSKRENPFLRRTELCFEVRDVEVPPSRKELREKVAALENVEAERVIILRVDHGFGSKRSVVFARIYASLEDLERAELPHVVGRNRGVKRKPGKEGEGEQEASEGKEMPSEAVESKSGGGAGSGGERAKTGESGVGGSGSGELGGQGKVGEEA